MKIRSGSPALSTGCSKRSRSAFFNYHEQKYAVAHKYGYLSDPSYGKRYQNDCAIVYTDEPIAIVMFTDNSPDSDNALCGLLHAHGGLCPEPSQVHSIRVPEACGPRPAPPLSPAAGASPAPSPAAASSPTPSPVPTKKPDLRNGQKRLRSFALKYVGYDYLYGGKEPGNRL